MKQVLFASVAFVLFVCPMSLAEESVSYSIEFKGFVENNGYSSGPLAGVSGGDTATIRFQVDELNYLDSPTYPVRGYVVDPASFSFTMGEVTVGLSDSSSTYFSIRDNDPGVDGVLLSRMVDYPSGVELDVPNAVLSLGRTFSTREMWDGLDIAGTQGYYEYEFISGYSWSVGPTDHHSIMAFDYRSFEITAVDPPVPGDLTGDGQVGGDDFALIAVNFEPGVENGLGDLNTDGFTDLKDFGILAHHFDENALVATVVPEPSGIFAMMLVSGLLKRRR